MPIANAHARLRDEFFARVFQVLDGLKFGGARFIGVGKALIEIDGPCLCKAGEGRRRMGREWRHVMFGFGRGLLEEDFDVQKLASAKDAESRRGRGGGATALLTRAAARISGLRGRPQKISIQQRTM